MAQPENFEQFRNRMAALDSISKTGDAVARIFGSYFANKKAAELKARQQNFQNALGVAKLAQEHKKDLAAKTYYEFLPDVGKQLDARLHPKNAITGAGIDLTPEKRTQAISEWFTSDLAPTLGTLNRQAPNERSRNADYIKEHAETAANNLMGASPEWKSILNTYAAQQAAGTLDPQLAKGIDELKNTLAAHSPQTAARFADFLGKNVNPKVAGLKAKDLNDKMASILTAAKNSVNLDQSFSEGQIPELISATVTSPTTGKKYTAPTVEGALSKVADEHQFDPISYKQIIKNLK